MRFWEDAHPPQGGRSDMRGTAPAEEFNFVISESCRVRGSWVTPFLAVLCHNDSRQSEPCRSKVQTDGPLCMQAFPKKHTHTATWQFGK